MQVIGGGYKEIGSETQEYMYNFESEKLWESISKSGKGFDYSKRLVPINLKRDLSLGYQFSEMSLSIFLDLPIKVLPKKTPKGDGFKIKYLAVKGSKSLSRLVISLTENKYKKTFFKVTDIIIDSLNGVKEDKKIVKIIFNELFAFQDFFRQLESSKGMSENLQQGLFAELDFLEKNLFGKLSYKEALTSWQAPNKSAHDFSRKGVVVEIKSTNEIPVKKIKIANENQLDSGNLKKLYLCTNEIKRNVGQGQNLYKKVCNIRAILKKNDPSALNFFNALITKCGFFEEDKKKYNIEFKISRKFFHDVKGRFPRLSTSTLPKGIDKTSYSLDLNFCHNYLIDREEALSLFCK